jgi:LPS sulfotransferase NodH
VSRLIGILKWIKHFTLKLLDEQLAYVFNRLYSSRQRQHKLFIFGQGRSGSTLLESLLKSTNYFNSYGELLGPCPREVSNPFNYLAGLAKHSQKPFLFHLKIYHLSRERKNKIDPADFLHQLHADGWKMIYIKRENVIEQQLSNYVAEKRENYHKHDDEQETLSLVIDCGEFVEKVKERLRFLETEKRILSNIPHIEVVYESDLLEDGDHQKTINNILAFLALPRISVKTTLRKVNRQQTSDLIENYVDFEACLKQNGWGNFVR